MLPSLRPLIAESMERMAAIGYLESGRMHWDGDRESILARGAQTLRWCDANDPDNDQPRPSEVEMLDQIEAIVTDSKTKIAAQIREILGL